MTETSQGTSTAEVPPFHVFLRPALQALSDGSEKAAREVLEVVAEEMDLSEEQLAETISSGQGRVRNRVLWSLS